MLTSYNCNQCNQQICEICVNQKHKFHQGTCTQIYQRIQLEDYLSLIVPDFENSIKKLQNHLDKIKSLKQNHVMKDKQFKRSSFMINQFLSLFCNLDEPIPDFGKIQHILDQNSAKAYKCFCNICNPGWIYSIQNSANQNQRPQFNQQQPVNMPQQQPVNIPNYQPFSVTSQQQVNTPSNPFFSQQNQQIQTFQQNSQQQVPNNSSQLSQSSQAVNQNQQVSTNSQSGVNQIQPSSTVSQNQTQAQPPQQNIVSVQQNPSNSLVQQNQVAEEQKSSQEQLNQSSIYDQPRYQEFERLVDIEVQKKEDSILSEFIPHYQNARFKLLYQGTRDGFTVTQLKSKLAYQVCSNNITFILSNHGKVFGGFSRVKRTFPQFETNTYDSQAFIFQLNEKKVMPVNESRENKKLSVTHRSDYLCAFGSFVLNIASDCNIDQNRCYSHLGTGFLFPDEIRDETVINPGSDDRFEQECDLEHVDISTELYEKRRSYLAGARSFTVDEIEVYEIYYPRAQ
eukprot:403344744